MKVKLKQEEPKHLRVAVLVASDSPHPSREYYFFHKAKKDGIKPSDYARQITNYITEVIEDIRKFPELQLHILQQFTEDQHYTKLLFVLTALSETGEFSDFDRFYDRYGHKIVELDNRGISKIAKYLRQSNKGLSINPKAFPTDIYLHKGIELSTFEMDYFIEEIKDAYNPMIFNEVLSESSNAIELGVDPSGSSVKIDPPTHVIAPQDPDCISAITKSGVIITKDPEKYRGISDHYHELDIRSSPIGINLIQFYTIQPALLIDLIDAIKTLTKDWYVKRSFFTVLDELFSTMSKEEFIGVSFANFFIDDEYNAYQTMSDQRSKYQLHQIFSTYLQHDIFNVNNMEDLYQPGLHLIDVSALREEEQYMVDIMFRLLHRYDFIEGRHVSDIFGKTAKDDYQGVLKRVYMDTYCQPSTILVPQFTMELYKTRADLIIMKSDMIGENLEIWQRGMMGIVEFYPYVTRNTGYVITTRDGSTFVEKLNEKGVEPEHQLDLLQPVVFDYSVTASEDEEIIDIEDEDLEIYDETYLSQYHIVSTLSAMAKYKSYDVQDVELSLWCEENLTDRMEELTEREYLKRDGQQYRATHLGRTYCLDIVKEIKEVTSEIEEDPDENSLNLVTSYITDFLTSDTQDKQFELILQLYVPLNEITERLGKEGIMYHYYGLYASIKWKISHNDEQEQTDLYMREFNSILDDLTGEQDLVNRINEEMELQDEPDFNEAIEEIMQSDDITEVMEEVIHEDDPIHKEQFKPATYPGEVGLWYPTKNFNEILSSVIEEETDEVSAIELYLLYQINYYEISTDMELEILLSRSGFTQYKESLLKTSWLTHAHEEHYGFEVDIASLPYPMVPPISSSMRTDRIIPYLEKILVDLPDQIKSQQVKKKVISILSKLGLQAYTFAIHALMLEYEPVLVELIENILQGIVYPSRPIPDYLRDDIENSELYKRLHNLIPNQDTGETPSNDDEPTDQSLSQSSDTKAKTKEKDNTGIMNPPNPPVPNSKLKSTEDAARSKESGKEDEKEYKDTTGNKDTSPSKPSILNLPKPAVDKPTKQADTGFLSDKVFEIDRRKANFKNRKNRTGYKKEEKSISGTKNEKTEKVNKSNNQVQSEKTDDSSTKNSDNEEEPLTILGYPLPSPSVKNRSSSKTTNKQNNTEDKLEKRLKAAPPAMTLPKVDLSEAKQKRLDRLQSQYPQLKIDTINPRGDLSLDTMIEIVEGAVDSLDGGPDQILKETIQIIFAAFDQQFADVSTEMMITELVEISKRIDISFNGFIQNFAVIRSKWQSQESDTILYYYINRIIATANVFEWNSKIEDYLK